MGSGGAFTRMATGASAARAPETATASASADALANSSAR
jgi:hypothetical protein